MAQRVVLLGQGWAGPEWRWRLAGPICRQRGDHETADLTYPRRSGSPKWSRRGGL